MDARSIMKWRWANAQLFHQFPGEWVAFSLEKGIIGHHPKRKQLYNTLIEEQGYRSGEFILEYIHPDEIPAQPYRIRLVRIKSVRKKDWLPKYLVKLSTEKGILEEAMLIDSGADISIITKQAGENLGLALAEGEILDKAEGVGGGIVDYVERRIKVEIDNHAIQVPIAWIQNEDINEMIIGREVVFDAFDIEFKQADEEIIFRKRPDKTGA